MDLPHPNRINLDDRAEVLLWADLLAITPERLLEIAARVGSMAPAVRFYAAKSAGTARGPKAVDAGAAKSSGLVAIDASAIAGKPR